MPAFQPLNPIYTQHLTQKPSSFSEIKNTVNPSTKNYETSLTNYALCKIFTIPPTIGTSRLFYHDENNPFTTTDMSTNPSPIPVDALIKGYFIVANAVPYVKIDSSQELVDALIEKYGTCGKIGVNLCHPVMIKGEGGTHLNYQLVGTAIDNSQEMIDNGNGNNLLRTDGNNSTIWLRIESIDPPKVSAAIGWKRYNG